jgi:hypothetical protein
MSAQNFTAAMVQMRTGLLPEPSLEQGIGLIREAAAQGADYVLTPEVSNMMQLNRKALFENLASEEDDKSLKAYRALALELKIFLHIGSLALRFSPEKAVNRSFPIAPDGNLLASYDKIHMFDIELPDGESYRESANYQPGETAVISDLPWGRIGLTICYDVRFPALYRALAEAGARSYGKSAFTQTGSAWLPRVRACDQDRLLRTPAKPECTRTSASLWAFADRRSWGVLITGRRARVPGEIDRKVDTRGRPFRHCSTAAALGSPTSRRVRSTCTSSGARHDPLFPALRTGPRLRKLVPEFRCL